jgi:hypothetical protein
MRQLSKNEINDLGTEMTNEEKWIEYRRSVGLSDQSPEIEDGWDKKHNCSNRVARLIYMNDSDTYGD